MSRQEDSPSNESLPVAVREPAVSEMLEASRTGEGGNPIRECLTTNGCDLVLRASSKPCTHSAQGMQAQLLQNGGTPGVTDIATSRPLRP